MIKLMNIIFLSIFLSWLCHNFVIHPTLRAWIVRIQLKHPYEWDWIEIFNKLTNKLPDDRDWNTIFNKLKVPTIEFYGLSSIVLMIGSGSKYSKTDKHACGWSGLDSNIQTDRSHNASEYHTFGCHSDCILRTSPRWDVLKHQFTVFDNFIIYDRKLQQTDTPIWWF